jgi:hypothetical protein
MPDKLEDRARGLELAYIWLLLARPSPKSHGAAFTYS